VHTEYDPETTVKYNVYQGSQWISYDDAQSFNDKKKFISKRCLSGWMIWAIDQDDGEFNALSGLIGQDLSTLQMKGNGDGRSKKVLADTFAAYTGQNCFVTDRCTNGEQKFSDQICPSGYLSVETAHNPYQAGGKSLHGDCDEGWFRHICCPKDAMPKNCEWNGAPERSEFGCAGKCGSTQFKLNQDTALDAKGEGQCFTGARFLCCDSAAMFQRCSWTDCQGPLVESDPTKCPTGDEFYTYRFDKPSGKPWCSDTYVSPTNGQVGSPHKEAFKSGLCCSEDQPFKNCQWTNIYTNGDPLGETCKPRPCSPGRVKIASAIEPRAAPKSQGPGNLDSCETHVPDDGMNPEWSYCCDPPTKYNKNWPVNPKYLWEKYYNDPDSSDVAWKYSDEYANNDEDDERSTEEDGTDAYGFVMLDGPEGSLDNDFSTTQTVVRRSIKAPLRKRSVLTNNQTAMDRVFDHAEETFHVYCNYPAGSKQCERVFIDGAEDTIISLPPHVGEGPFARIVSMKLADGYQLPDHHLHHRSLENINNPVYKVKIDYNFQDIKLKRDDDAVQIRVDYTNLLGYWDEMTGSPARRRKRGVNEEPYSQDEWRAKVRRAASQDKKLRKREEPVKVRTPFDVSGSHLQKRWFGAFGEWLRKLVSLLLPFPCDLITNGSRPLSRRVVLV
jgi:chitinase